MPVRSNGRSVWRGAYCERTAPFLIAYTPLANISVSSQSSKLPEAIYARSLPCLANRMAAVLVGCRVCSHELVSLFGSIPPAKFLGRPANLHEIFHRNYQNEIDTNLYKYSILTMVYEQMLGKLERPQSTHILRTAPFPSSQWSSLSVL